MIQEIADINDNILKKKKLFVNFESKEDVMRAFAYKGFYKAIWKF